MLSRRSNSCYCRVAAIVVTNPAQQQLLPARLGILPRASVGSSPADERWMQGTALACAGLLIGIAHRLLFSSCGRSCGAGSCGAGSCGVGSCRAGSCGAGSCGGGQLRGGQLRGGQRSGSRAVIPPNHATRPPHFAPPTSEILPPVHQLNSPPRASSCSWRDTQTQLPQALPDPTPHIVPPNSDILPPPSHHYAPPTSEILPPVEIGEPPKDFPFQLAGYTDIAPDEFVYAKTPGGNWIAAAQDPEGRLFMIDEVCGGRC